MRWEIIKKAWALARQEFPKVSKLTLVPPARIGLVGSIPVYDGGEPEKPIGYISFKASKDGERIEVTAGKQTAEVKNKRSMSIRGGKIGFDVLIAKRIQHEAKKPKFKPYARVRVTYEGSKDFGECGKVIGHKPGPPTWYLVLVDGSSEPKWFREKALKLDEAGGVDE